MLRLPRWQLGAAALLLTLSACQDDSVVTPEASPYVAPPALGRVVRGQDPAAQISAQMDATNRALAAGGSNLRVAKAEYIGSGQESGTQVVQKDLGNKRLRDGDFVPNDPRRIWSGAPGGRTDDITYAVDQVDAVPPSPGLTAAATNAAIDAAMATWNAVRCSNLGIRRVSDQGADLGAIAAINGLGGSQTIAADIMHAGFSDINFAGLVIGSTFTFIFIDTDTKLPTDIDNNGLQDVAFREIYYDPSWLWTDGSFPGVDVQSIALHEAGHGLSQAHFGNLTMKKGVLSASPRAVMNALYQDEQRSLYGSDVAGHCGNWAQWPNN